MDVTDSPEFSAAEARAAVEAAIGACSAVTSEPITQRRLVTQAVASFVTDWGSVRPPLYLVRGHDVDVGALQVLSLLLFNAANMFVQVWAPSSFIKAKGCVIHDLSASDTGFFYWVSQAAYQRSLIRALPGSEEGDGAAPVTVLIITPELAAEACAWGYILELSQPCAGAAEIKALPERLGGWKDCAKMLAGEIERELIVDLSPLDEAAS